MLGKKLRTRLGLVLAGAVVFSSAMSGVKLDASAAAAAPVVYQLGGWLESAYVTWEAADSTGYNVYVNGENGTVKLDDELVRLYSSDSGDKYFRADAMGLSAGNYSFRIVPVENDKELSDLAAYTDSVYVDSHDRSGFAFVNGESNGAYNYDGTLKNNAVVLYVTNETKDSVSLDVVTNAKGATTSASGLQNILNLYKKGYDSRPLDVRFVGQITDFSTMEGGDIVISGSGDSKRVSCGITFEGIGEDATADGWGLRIKNASNVEVRNLGFMNCDSSEGDDIGLQQSNDHIWVHNCDLFYGLAGGDADQAKGDGALDTKKSTYVTHSYNHFYDTGKSNLQGMKSESTENYITYHHNWYDHSDSRHPRIRTCSVHIYNNYYDGNAKYGVGVTMGASAFVEANYYRNCKFPMLISEQGSDVIADWETLTRDEDLGTFSSENGGIIKSFNNYIEGAKSYVTYQENPVEFDAYEVSSRDEYVPSDVTALKGGSSYNNFDTSSVMYSYNADEPDVAKEKVEAFAGRENGGDFYWDFNDEVDDTDYGVNRELKAALNTYSTKLISVGGNGNSDDSGSGSSEASSEDSSEDSGSDASSEDSSEEAGSEESSEAASEASSEDSGSEASSEASTEEPSDPEPGVSETKYVHNFTASGKNSDFYQIEGNLSTTKGSVTYDGKLFTQCLKIESKTSIKFTAPEEGKLTLVFGDNDSSIKLDGAAKTDPSNVLVLDITKGAHELTKKDVENLFYMVLEVKGSEEAEEPGTGDDSGNEASSEESSEAASESSSEEASSEESSEASSESSSEDAAGESSSEEVTEPQEPETPEEPQEPTEELGHWLTKWGTHYYVLPSGVYATGLLKIEGDVYSFNQNGAMITSTFVKFQDGTRFFGKDGKMVTGWFERWFQKYYFDGNGLMLTGKNKVEDSTYYFDGEGKMVTSSFVIIDGNTYYFDKDGKMVTGKMTKWFKTYYFDENGVLIN